ncbi:MAG: pyrroline-5-carboxylate reductase family protein, partial [Promethearchaeota archaeon]
MFKKELGVIGIGKIGNTLVNRFISTKVITKNDIIVYDVDDLRLNRKLKELDIERAEDNISLVKNAKFVLIAVIPQVIDEVLAEIASEIKEDHIIISIAAGISISHIKKYINKQVGIVRVMTNTPALVGAAATV